MESILRSVQNVTQELGWEFNKQVILSGPKWLLAGGLKTGASVMTEYVIKKIGHQWIAYANGLTIGACPDETAALKLITEDSAKYGAKKTRRGEPASRSGNLF